jgi:hypothetical protein
MIRQIIAVLDTMNGTRYGDLSAVFEEFKSRGIEVSYSEGATKGCFIFKNFVLKFNLEDGDSRRIDDCVGRELEIYNKAKEKGLEKILVPTYPFYTNCYGITFIKQQKISCSIDSQSGKKRKENVNKCKNVSNKAIYKVRRGFYKRTCSNSQWLARAIQIYGKNFMKDFEQFTHEYQINDLHYGNIGYIGKLPVILDFSGY